MTEARAFIDEIWSSRETSHSPLTIDAYLGTDDPRSGRRWFSEVPDDAREFVYKLNDSYLEDEFIRDLAPPNHLDDQTTDWRAPVYL